MSWFDRLLNKKPASGTAGWTDLPDDRVDSFVATVTLAVLEVVPDERTSVDASNGTIQLPDLGLTLDLRDLAKRCRPVRRDAWAPLIAAQVERWLATPPFPPTLAAALPLLRVQLTSRAPDPAYCARELATNLAAELCLDGGAELRRTRVDVATLATWGATADEAWARGVANLSADIARADEFKLDDPIQLAFHHVHGSRDTASLALRLPDLGDAAAHGWLFMVPHAGSLWYAPLHTLDQCAAGMMMHNKAVDEMRTSLPLSGDVYWTDGTHFAAIPRDGARTGFELIDVITGAVRRLTSA